MTNLSVVLDGTDGTLTEKLKDADVVQTQDGLTLVGIPRGMQSGMPSVAFILDLPDGKKLFAETSLKALIVATEVLRKKYAEELDGKSPKPAAPSN